MKTCWRSGSTAPCILNLGTRWRRVVSFTFLPLYPRDSSGGISLGYELDDRSSRVRFPAGTGNFSLHNRVQNGSGAHPASYSMGTRGSFPESKAAGAWSWPLTSIYCRGQRMSGVILPLPQYAFMVWCWVKKAQGQLYLYLTFTHQIGGWVTAGGESFSIIFIYCFHIFAAFQDWALLNLYNCCNCCTFYELDHLASFDSEFTSETMNPSRHFGKHLGRGVGLSQCLSLYRKAQNKKVLTYVHASSGIRTHDPSLRAFQNHMHLKPRGHWNRPIVTVW
jgi:hypothetical protein